MPHSGVVCTFPTAAKIPDSMSWNRGVEGEDLLGQERTVGLALVFFKVLE
jgi:hypothetical protein